MERASFRRRRPPSTALQHPHGRSPPRPGGPADSAPRWSGSSRPRPRGPEPRALGPRRRRARRRRPSRAEDAPQTDRAVLLDSLGRRFMARLLGGFRVGAVAAPSPLISEVGSQPLGKSAKNFRAEPALQTHPEPPRSRFHGQEPGGLDHLPPPEVCEERPPGKDVDAVVGPPDPPVQGDDDVACDQALLLEFAQSLEMPVRNKVRRLDLAMAALSPMTRSTPKPATDRQYAILSPLFT